ncbi:MAG: aldo/keto reductase [Pseudomonadales bacterium]
MSDSAESTSWSTRRRFVRYGSMLAVGCQALVRSGSVRAAFFEAQESDALATPWPQMAYRTLGRTGFRASRLVFGCGASLSGRRRDELLDMAFDAGVNVFDVGYRHYYDAAERNLAPFLKRRRDDVFLISKAIVPGDFGPADPISVGQARAAASGWSALLDESLRELDVDHVDAYYLMASNNPQVIASDEIHAAFERAREAGKVSYLGLSTHQNAQRVLEAAIDTGRFDLAMIAITPGGWYDWETREVLPGSPPMKALRPLLDRARGAGIGLIGMKAGRYLAGRQWLGWGNPDAFDPYYEPKLLRAGLSEFQRSYAFVLENGLDAVNADIQAITHLRENFVAAATSSAYFDVA